MKKQSPTNTRLFTQFTWSVLFVFLSVLFMYTGVNDYLVIVHFYVSLVDKSCADPVIRCTYVNTSKSNHTIKQLVHAELLVTASIYLIVLFNGYWKYSMKVNRLLLILCVWHDKPISQTELCLIDVLHFM